MREEREALGGLGEWKMQLSDQSNNQSAQKHENSQFSFILV